VRGCSGPFVGAGRSGLPVRVRLFPSFGLDGFFRSVGPNMAFPLRFA